MKKNQLLKILSFLFLVATVQAQDVTYTFANAQNTNEAGNDYYEADIMIESAAGFKLGSGLLYFNYNTAAFGTNIQANDRITITAPNGTHILGEMVAGLFPFYDSFITNDNTTSRVAFSWQQAFSGECLAVNNVTATTAALFHIRIEYTDVNQAADICYESDALFVDQTFTACGSTGGGCATDDCFNSPGIQITNDTYDCTGADVNLPVELTSFTAQAAGLYSRLDWSTASEINNEGFMIQRLEGSDEWIPIDFVQGKGDTDWMENYTYYDKTPKFGKNYYRLKQIDFDGNYEYAEVRVVEFKGEALIVENLFPNPTNTGSTSLKLWSPKEEEVLIEVYDLSGRQYSKQFHKLNSGWNGIDFRFDENQSQVYFIRLSLSNQVITKRLVVSGD